MKNHFSEQPRKIKFYGLQSSGCCFCAFFIRCCRCFSFESCCFPFQFDIGTDAILSALISLFRMRLRVAKARARAKNKRKIQHGNLDQMHDNRLHSNGDAVCWYRDAIPFQRQRQRCTDQSTQSRICLISHFCEMHLNNIGFEYSILELRIANGVRAMMWDACVCVCCVALSTGYGIWTFLFINLLLLLLPLIYIPNICIHWLQRNWEMGEHVNSRIRHIRHNHKLMMPYILSFIIIITALRMIAVCILDFTQKPNKHNLFALHRDSHAAFSELIKHYKCWMSVRYIRTPVPNIRCPKWAVNHSLKIDSRFYFMCLPICKLNALPKSADWQVLCIPTFYLRGWNCFNRTFILIHKYRTIILMIVFHVLISIQRNS